MDQFQGRNGESMPGRVMLESTSIQPDQCNQIRALPDVLRVGMNWQLPSASEKEEKRVFLSKNQTVNSITTVLHAMQASHLVYY